jgi:hypothetical protein
MGTSRFMGFRGGHGEGIVVVSNVSYAFVSRCSTWTNLFVEDRAILQWCSSPGLSDVFFHMVGLIR